MNKKKLIGKRHRFGARADIIILSDNLSFIQRLAKVLDQVEEDFWGHEHEPEHYEEIYQKLFAVQKELLAELSIREEYHGLSYPTPKNND